MSRYDPRYAKKWRYDRSHGELRLQDANDARLHIATCLGQGMSLRAIAAAAGVSVQSVHKIHHGQATARQATITGITAVDPGVTRESTPDTTEPFVPKVGAVRRVQALLALGWTHALLTEHAGLRTGVMLHQQGRWVTLSTFEAIERVYNELCMKPGPSERTRGRAAAMGYVPPLGWDDIDNDETPVATDDLIHTRDDYIDEAAVERALTGEPVTLTKAERDEAVRRLHQVGATDSTVSKRLGMSGETARLTRHRLGLEANERESVHAIGSDHFSGKAAKRRRDEALAS